MRVSQQKDVNQDGPASAEKSKRVTPMMAQYNEIKAANPGSLLFYRMGDFYELFFDDAEIASKALGITLTKRGQHLGEDIPMCGVPFHAADDYLNQLIRLGHKVAVCEQTEDPAEAKKRGSKSVVKRDVVRLITPGTLTEEKLLEASRANYLVAVSSRKKNNHTELNSQEFALAWLDISTGVFAVKTVSFASLAGELARLDPGEIIVSESFYDSLDFASFWSQISFNVTPLTYDYFDSTNATHRLKEFFGVLDTQGFGDFTQLEFAACGAIVAYISLTQIGSKPAISPPQKQLNARYMVIDAATRANLEINTNLRGEREGSLIKAIDRTLTPAGTRLLSERLNGPLTVSEEINERLDSLEILVNATVLREDIRQTLKGSADLARALSRISLLRAGPRDLGVVQKGLETASQIVELFKNHSLLGFTKTLENLLVSLTCVDDKVRDSLSSALKPELPQLVRDGGFVVEGYHDELDQVRELRDNTRSVVAGLQQTYSDLTGIKSLKVKHNNVLGYFVDVTALHGQKLMEEPLNETFIHRQTLANAIRFSTVELGELEAKISAAVERAQALEQEIFQQLCDLVMSQASELQNCAQALAEIDVLTGLAELATDQIYVRPTVDDSLRFTIDGGRHPVAQSMLRKEGKQFVANDCELGPKFSSAKPQSKEVGQILLITGPNMAGKSTYLRQNAIIAILAQMGSFVPAKSAHIGVIDRLFSRVGASDDLARGRSTFMVEMLETATILNQSAKKSLVILDEIGRGTATFDGLSIAWATIEHLHNTNKTRTLFATHFHELTDLAAKLPRLTNATMKVKEWDGDVVFLHEVIGGTADRSYGVQVAKLAGLPKSVISRAHQVLDILESTDAKKAGDKLANDLPLFSVVPEAAKIENDPAMEKIVEMIQNLNPDDITAKDALDFVYRLKLELKKK